MTTSARGTSQGSKVLRIFRTDSPLGLKQSGRVYRVPTRSQRRFTQEFKDEAVRMVLEGDRTEGFPT